jgi:hypothetical protein
VSQDAGLNDPNPPSSATIGKLKTDTTLADSGLPNDANHPTIALDRVCELPFKGGELVVSSYEAAQANSAAEYFARRSAS